MIAADWAPTGRPRAGRFRALWVAALATAGGVVGYLLGSLAAFATGYQ